MPEQPVWCRQLDGSHRFFNTQWMNAYLAVMLIQTLRGIRKGSLAGSGLCLLLLMGQAAFAQPVTRPHRLTAQLELGGFASTTSAVPFWIRSNQYGIIPTSAPALTIRAGLYRDYAREDTLKAHRRRLDWGFGFTAVGNREEQNHFFWPEAYLKVKYRAFEFYAGRRRELTGLGDSTLSSGFIIGSGNAQPIPKVQLATRGFIPLKFLREFVAIKAGFAHGWFNVPYVQGSYLHQKYAYLRFGKPKSTVKGYVGLNHQVQWGGQANYLIGTDLAVDGKLPSSFKYYGNIILANSPKDLTTADYTDFDGSYRIGNHLGSWDFGLEVSRDRAVWQFYHQHPYDDVSGLLFINIPDGLYGLSWHRKADSAPVAFFRIQRFVVEWLTTMDQSGPTFWRPGSRYQGKDNYFNHSQYWKGWSYLDKAIGTPFIAPQTDLQPAAQGAQYFSNNRLKMGYAGLQGVFANRLLMTVRLSYSLNYGTYNNPYPTSLSQFSGYASAQIPLPFWSNTQLTTTLALDQGDLFINTLGGFISLKKNW